MSDYLWSKLGHDAEIERLERELSSLQYTPRALPLEARASVENASNVIALPLRRPLPPLRPTPWFSRPAMQLLAASIVAIAGGVLTAVMATPHAASRPGWALVPVTVATVDVSEGTVLTEAMLGHLEVPDNFVSNSVVRPESSLFAVGQVVRVPLSKGDPVLWSHFETRHSLERLSYLVVRQLRAVALDASGTAALSGWLKPNDHIDIVAAIKDPSTGREIATTLLENVTLLATGQLTMHQASPRALSDYSNVSVMVLPEEAELLTLAQQVGHLRFSLRNPDDDSTLATRAAVTVDSLLNQQQTRALERRRNATIQVIRNTK